MRRRIIASIAGLVIWLGITGCERGPKVDMEEDVSIKVMFWDQRNFDEQFGNLFTTLFPNIHIEVVPISEAYNQGMGELAKLIDAEKPDVLYIPVAMYATLANQGELVNLETLIKKDKFDIENIHPSVVEMIKAKGNGRLYGLSPTFSSAALFINKSMFDQHGVSYPQEYSGWENILALAGRFPKNKDEIYGFYSFNIPNQELFTFIESIASSQGLLYLDHEGKRITINNEKWKSVWDRAINAYKSGSIYLLNDNPQKNLFLQGKAAMTIDSYSFVADLERDRVPFNWDVVTVPTSPDDSGKSNLFGLTSVYAIYAKSSKQAYSWKLLKYINSEEWTAIKSKSSQYTLWSRTKHIQDRNGHNLAAFYKIKPTVPNFELPMEVPPRFYREFYELADREAHAVIDGKKTLEEALETVEKQGNDLLKRSREAGTQ